MTELPYGLTVADVTVTDADRKVDPYRMLASRVHSGHTNSLARRLIHAEWMLAEVRRVNAGVILPALTEERDSPT